MFNASDADRYPVLAAQDNSVQALATNLNAKHVDRNHIRFRSDCGALIIQLEKSNLTCINAKGEAMTQEETVFAICREIGIGRSTYYLYRNDYITTQTYPPKIQEGAIEARLNLAPEHVQAKFAGMLLEGGLLHDKNLEKLTALEVKGVISELETDKPKPEDDEPLTKDELTKRLNRLFKRAKKDGLFEKVIVTFNNNTVDFVNTPDKAGELFQLLAGEFPQADLSQITKR